MNIKDYFTLIMILLVLSNCVPSGEQTQTSTRIHTQLPTEIQATEMVVSTITAAPLLTNTPQPAMWTVVENWTPANQIRTLLVDRSGHLWAGGPAGLVHWDVDTGKPVIYTLRAESENTNVLALVQAYDGTIWAGTFGNGIAIFGDTDWESLTTENGLPGDYILSLIATGSGGIWADIQKKASASLDGQDYSFGHFSKRKWIDEVGGGFFRIAALPDNTIVGAVNYPFTGSFFISRFAIYDGQKWNESDVIPDGWVDAITVAPDGVIWIATDDTIYRYQNRAWIPMAPPWAGKEFPSVTSIAVSANGIAWFGFSYRSQVWDSDSCGSRDPSWEEQGVYRYDGNTWTHFTVKDGLVDNKICAIALDAEGNPWFGTFDEGISYFDGNTWTRYVIQ